MNGMEMHGVKDTKNKLKGGGNKAHSEKSLVSHCDPNHVV